MPLRARTLVLQLCGLQSRVQRRVNPSFVYCSVSDGAPFVMEGGGASHGRGRAAKQLDVTQKPGAPMMLALAGAQTVARAYMSVRRSLPKVTVCLPSERLAQGRMCACGVPIHPLLLHSCLWMPTHRFSAVSTIDLQLPLDTSGLPGVGCLPRRLAPQCFILSQVAIVVCRTIARSWTPLLWLWAALFSRWQHIARMVQKQSGPRKSAATLQQA